MNMPAGRAARVPAASRRLGEREVPEDTSTVLNKAGATSRRSSNPMPQTVRYRPQASAISHLSGAVQYPSRPASCGVRSRTRDRSVGESGSSNLDLPICGSRQERHWGGICSHQPAPGAASAGVAWLRCLGVDTGERISFQDMPLNE